MPPKVDKERDVEAYFKRQWTLHKGKSRKLRWLCRTGAPDRFAWLPGDPPSVFFVELKRPKGATRATQKVEHRILRADGLEVHVLDTRLLVDNFIRTAVDTHSLRCRMPSRHRAAAAHPKEEESNEDDTQSP